MALFVCVHNAGRSQMAEAFYNHLARGKDQALSAGTNPEDTVNPLVVAVMKEIGIDISHNLPKKLTIHMLEQAARVITMGCTVEQLCPATFTETEDWDLEDPKDKSVDKVREIRDKIHKRVAVLIQEL